MLLRQLIATIERRGWRLYTAPFELNIVGLRSAESRAGHFDDLIVTFYRDRSGAWQFHQWPATTDPGLPYLHLPIHELGTAILAEGQYEGAYEIAKHRGLYSALCQRRAPVRVIRDDNRDGVLDFGGGEVYRGMFGINIHRALSAGQTPTVEQHSAGCQVFRNAADFNDFMELCRTHEKLHGNVFTYSLIDLRALKKARRKRWVLRGSLLGGAALAGLLLVTSLETLDDFSNPNED